MQLTKSETEIAERWLSKREKQLAQWPRTRWLILAIFLVFMFFGYRTLNDGMRSIRDDKTIDSYVSSTIRATPPPGLEQRWAIGTQLKVARLLEARQQEAAYSLMEVGLGYVEILSGAVMVCLIVLRSKRVERDALICKLLRAKLHELEQDAAPDNRLPSRSPALEIQSSDSRRSVDV